MEIRVGKAVNIYIRNVPINWQRYFFQFSLIRKTYPLNRINDKIVHS